jgi:hypothetical protein
LTIIDYPFTVDHYWLSFYCRPLLFILLFRSLMFILLFRPLLFICLVSTIIIYPFIVDHYYTPAPRRGRGYTVSPLSVIPSVQDIFRHTFLSNCWWQKSDIWSHTSYRYTILWVAFLDPSDSYFLFANLVGFYTHWTYMLIFHRIFLSNYW